MLSDIQLTILALVATAAGAIIIGGYFLGLMLKNQRLQMVAKEEILEWGSTIFMIGALTYLLAGPIPEVSCKAVVWLLDESGVNCEDPVDREAFVDGVLNSSLQKAYKVIGDKDVKERMDLLVQGALSRIMITIPIGVTAFRNPFADAASLGDIFNTMVGQLVGQASQSEAQANQIDLGGLRTVEQIREQITNTRLGGSTSFSYQPCNYLMLYYSYAIYYINYFTTYRTTIYVINLLISDLYEGFVWGFLVVGLLLRSFNISRRIGGFFISFALAVALLPYLTAFFLKIIEKVDARFGDQIAQEAINDILLFTALGDSVKTTTEGNVYCKEDIDLFESNFNNLYHIATTPTSGLVSFGVYGLLNLLSLGMALLAVISITVGIGQLFGIEISPFVLSYIARLR